MKGDPVEIASRNNYQVQEDYRSSGHQPITIRRYYNSIKSKYYTPAKFVFEPFGPGWSGDYFQSIKHLDSVGLSTAFANRPDGQVITFGLSGGELVSSPDIKERLIAQRDGAGAVTGWTLRTRSDAAETYDAAGRLLQITYRGGAVHTLIYDAYGLLKYITDDAGRQVQIVLDDQRRVSRLIDPAGQSTIYGYAPNNTLASVTYQDSRSRQYHYNGYYLTGVTDENASRYATFTYDSSGNAVSTELAGGVYKYVVSGGTYSRTVTDPLGKQRTYGHSGQAILHELRIQSSSSYCAGCGEPKQVIFDANANIASRTDFNNVVTQYAYDMTRNLETSRTEAYGTARARTIYTDWHPSFRLPTQIEEPGRSTSYTYDVGGNVLTKVVIDPVVGVSRAWTYTYNGYGQVLDEAASRRKDSLMQ